MSDEERDKPKRPVGNMTMQIDAFRDQVELYDDAEDIDDAEGSDSEGEEGHLTAPPPLPPRSTHAPSLAPLAPAATPAPSSKVGVIVIGVVVAVVAIGAALFVSGMLVDEPTEAPAAVPSARPEVPAEREPAEHAPAEHEPETAPALEIGPIEIDTTTAAPAD